MKYYTVLIMALTSLALTEVFHRLRSRLPRWNVLTNAQKVALVSFISLTVMLPIITLATLTETRLGSRAVEPVTPPITPPNTPTPTPSEPYPGVPTNPKDYRILNWNTEMLDGSIVADGKSSPFPGGGYVKYYTFTLPNLSDYRNVEVFFRSCPTSTNQKCQAFSGFLEQMYLLDSRFNLIYTGNTRIDFDSAPITANKTYYLGVVAEGTRPISNPTYLLTFHYESGSPSPTPTLTPILTPTPTPTPPAPTPIVNNFTVRAILRNSDGTETVFPSANAAGIIRFEEINGSPTQPRVNYVSCMSGGILSLPIVSSGTPCSSFAPGRYATQWKTTVKVGGTTYKLIYPTTCTNKSCSIREQSEMITGGQPVHRGVYQISKQKVSTTSSLINKTNSTIKSAVQSVIQRVQQAIKPKKKK